MADLLVDGVCLTFGFVVGLICLAASYVIGGQRNTPLLGFLLGLLGPVGLLVCLLIDYRRCCPICGRRVNHGEPTCRGCGTALQWSKERIPAITRIEVSRTCPACRATITAPANPAKPAPFWTCPVCGEQSAVTR